MPTLLLCRLRALVEMLQMLEIYAQDTSPTNHCAGHDAIKCARIFLHHMGAAVSTDAEFFAASYSLI